jgi:hypothetical protein
LVNAAELKSRTMGWDEIRSEAPERFESFFSRCGFVTMDKNDQICLYKRKFWQDNLTKISHLNY